VLTSEPTSRDSVALRIDDLGKQYPNGTWGLRHASTSFLRGRMTALLGPNGAGKSTLIHLLAGAIRPSEGHIHLPDPGSRIGWSSQRTTIDWYLNVIDNVTLGARLAGYDRRQSREKALRILDLLQLGELATNDVSMLSGGQQQRIQVARTLVADPDILLLDEPTASLDVASAESVLGHMRNLTQEDETILISSHDLGLLERFCDDVLFIHDGRIIAHDAMQSFLRRYAPSESVTLHLDGTVTPAMLERIRLFNPRQEQDARLTASIPSGATIGSLVTLLEPDIRVLDISRKTASLRDIYLKMTTREGGQA